MNDHTQLNQEFDAERLLERQRDAFIRHEIPDLHERLEKLDRLRWVVIAHRAEIEEAINADFGNRSRHETDLMELAGVVQAIDYLKKNLRKFMRAERRHVGALFRAGKALVEQQPKGVIGIMAPWNYPFSLTLIPLATALAAGNRAMLKPSELTPRTSELIKRIVAQVFSEEEVAVVLGGVEVGAAFSRLAFDHLLFTGSTQVGRQVMRAASENLVPVTLELGGKSPAVLARGHIDSRTMGSIVFGKLSNAGQTCVAPDYVLVHEEDIDEFIAQFHSAVSRTYPEGPCSRDYTSIASQRHHERLLGLIGDASSKGARVIEVGVNPKSASKRPCTLAPTLIIGAGNDTHVMQQEIFGPILPVVPYRSIDEVISYINERPRPLALYYFGNQDADCKALLTRTTSGNVGINNTIMHVAMDDLPFGGIGASGMGAYHGIEGFRSMSHAKGIFIQGRWSLPSLLRAPFGRLADTAIKALLRPTR